MPSPLQPYASREETFRAFAEWVSRGKAHAFESYDLDVVMGDRSGSTFTDAFDGRRFLNCHCNGGVFNLGHRNPAVLRAVRDVRRAYVADARMWHLLQRLRRLDRAWHRWVRGQTYPFLLPGRIERHV